MYRDMIGEIVKIECSGSTFFFQQFKTSGGKLKSIVLYDEDGDRVAAFRSIDEMSDYLVRNVSEKISESVLS